MRKHDSRYLRKHRSTPWGHLLIPGGPDLQSVRLRGCTGNRKPNLGPEQSEMSDQRIPHTDMMSPHLLWEQW